MTDTILGNLRKLFGSCIKKRGLMASKKVFFMYVKSMTNKYDDCAKQVRDRKRKTATQPQSDFSGSDDQLNHQLTSARAAVANQVKSYVVAGGIQDALADLSVGNFGSSANDAFAMLNNSLTVPLQVDAELMQESFNPKNLLMPSQASST